MSAEALDCIVIGSGPGGYVAAIRAAQLGMRTAIVERDRIGGRCLNYACIPAKAILRVADVAQEIREAGNLGLDVAEPSIDFDAVQRRRETVVKTLTGGVAGLLRKNRVEVVQGTGRLTSASSVAVSTDAGTQDTHLEAGAVILATGSIRRAVPGVEYGGRVIGTEEAWALGRKPASLAVLGAGASGVEIASAYARLGTKVTLLEALDQVLPTEDAEISKLVERGLRRHGIDVRTGARIADVASTDGEVTFSFGAERGTAELLVVATGRAPDVEALGLRDARVALTGTGLIDVDASMRTSVQGVWAIGDLVPGPALAHKASDEAVIAVEDAAGRTTHPISHADIPRVTFCAPNVASFGLTEHQARAAGHDVVVGKVPFGSVGAGTVYGDRAGLVKIVGDRRYGELLGGHIVGTRAPELIQQLVNVRAIDGGFPDVARTVHGHPTFSEAVMEAARAADGWLVHG